jgi:ATP-dependent Clp protease, protease subunit
VPKHSFMSVTNLTSTTADFHIYGEIVGSEWSKWDGSEVAPQDVQSFIDENLAGKSELNIYINSPGGEVFAGQAIISMLNRLPAKKIMHIDGVAASMASVIALSGDELVVPKNSFMMIHRPIGLAYGNVDKMQEQINVLNRINEGMKAVYKDSLKEGVDPSIIDEKLSDGQEDWWLTGDEVAEYFNVRVSEPQDIAAMDSDFYKNYKNTPSALLRKLKPVAKGQNPPPKQKKEEDEVTEWEKQIRAVIGDITPEQAKTMKDSVDTISALQDENQTLKANATIGEAYKADLVKAAVDARVAALGTSFSPEAKERYENMLNKSDDIEFIKDEITANQGEIPFTAGRQTKPQKNDPVATMEFKQDKMI